MRSSGVANSDRGVQAKGIRLNEVTSEHLAADLERVARAKSDFFMRPEVHAAHEIAHTTGLLDALAFELKSSRETT
ncbi:citrate lyase beta subunit [Variovorax boronicumulans]|uniref:hypothetical protein n=1 Tax=Variovorax boronicumulans TaxID=436515 RepID=UPI002783A782|nr:hypothetical protein [Variovorax boronicumulans]MDQ0039041.1 citrate lyase beta subunit [Variovorax boronicumulans]